MTEIPWAKAAEQAVLGAVLSSPVALAEVADVLATEDFYAHRHRAIFTACLALSERGEPVDPITTCAELERRGDLDKVGGAPYLHTVIASTPTAVNATYHADIVARKAQQRSLIETLERATQTARADVHTEDDLAEISGRVQTALDAGAGPRGHARALGGEQPIGVVPFPVLAPAALQGTAGEIVRAMMPHTEAHPAALLATLLARFGATVGATPHVRADNRNHPARLNILLVGKTSDGAKGTAAGAVNAVFTESCANTKQATLRQISGLSSGEGLIEAVRDGTGDDPEAKNFDEGILDKRLLVEEPEFTATLAVMERTGSILPRVIREAWDGDILRTTTRHAPLTATGAHIVITGHATPGELKMKIGAAQMVGGTMNRFLPIASRRTHLLPDGGNLPPDVLTDAGKRLAERINAARDIEVVQRTEAADDLWRARYAGLQKARPDGPVANMLSRAVAQVLRLSLAYALLDGRAEIDRDHLAAALALWEYACATAEWIFGDQIDTEEIENLVVFIARSGKDGRTTTEIANTFYAKNSTSKHITSILGQLIRDGRIRQEIDRSHRGRPTTRYHAC